MLIEGWHVFYSIVWCRRTDELVDGPNAIHITPKALEIWETRLNDLFEGQPYDVYDAALSYTISKYPVDIQVNSKWLTCGLERMFICAKIKIDQFTFVSLDSSSKT